MRRLSQKTLRRRRALERLNKDIAKYAALAPDSIVHCGDNANATKAADKLEKAQIQRAFLMAKPGVG